MLKSLFVKIFQHNTSLSQRNLRGISIDLRLNNLDLSGNTTEFKFQNITDAPTFTSTSIPGPSR